MDGAILVVSATDGPMPQTREHILSSRQIGVPAPAAHANKVDVVSDQAPPDPVESEVRESLAPHKYSHDTPLASGPALTAPKGDEPSIGVQSIQKSLDVVDESIPQPPRPVDQPFLMPVEDVPSTGGRGTVVTGKIERGTVKLGEDPETIGPSPVVPRTTCTGIEMFHKLLDYAEAGENVGSSLRSTKRTDVKRGQVSCKPGSIQAFPKSEAQVYTLAKEEGGRHTPFSSNHRPQPSCRTADTTGIVHLPEGIKMVLPGDHVRMTIESIAPIAPNEGLNLAIREGGKTVGAGVVPSLIAC